MQRRWTLTENELISISENELVQKVIDSLLDYVGSIAPGEDDYELVRQTPKPAQFFWGMRLMESEVSNGGFEQYFWNSSCTLADVALEAYQTLGAETYTNLLQRALFVAGNSGWRNRRAQFNDDWREYKKACSPELDELTEKFCATGRGSPESGGEDTDLYGQKVEYIRQNAKAICGEKV
ncbi:MAG TPA: DUF4375 domain-containing protein [Candidatus Sulfotelmatobacter sp.]|jgi:hypothetical protein